MSIPQRISVLLLVLLGPQGLAAQQQVSPFTSPVAGPNQSLLGIQQPNISGDLNGDGRDEVFGAGGNVMGWVIAGTGGVYGPPNVMTFTGGDEVRLNAVTDLTADGYADLLVTTQNFSTNSTSARIYPGDGSGGVLQPIFLPDAGLMGSCGSPHQAFVVEVVPNGRPDILLVICPMGGLPITYELRMLVHDPSAGGWNASMPFLLVPGPASVVDAVGDFNGDGHPDLIGRVGTGMGGTSSLFIVLGTPNPPYFSGPPLIFARPFPLSVTGGPVPLVADMNGDGADDVVMGDTVEPGLGPADIRVATAFGDAQAVLQPWTGFSPVSPAMAGWTGFYLEEFDGDGTPDLVILTYPTLPPAPPWTPFDVEFHRGRPDGTFAAPMVLGNNPPGFCAPTIADADGDGDLDLVCGFTPTTTVAFNESLVGSGAPAQGGTVPRLTRGRAELGNPGFFVGLEQAPPSSPVLLAASLGRLAPIPPSGIALDLTTLLWPLGAPGPATTDPDGRALQPLPLPADPALNGTAAYFQWAVASSNPQGFALSKAARIVLGW